MKEADRCVMCGLCLPHCPTYGLFNLESESPRGRIALMRALASGDLSPTAQLKEHLDHCLLCRACETACPAGVPFGQLIDAARASLEEAHGQPGTSSGLDRLERLFPALHLYQRSGMQKVARTMGLPRLFGLHRLERLLPRPSRQPQLREYYAAHGSQRGKVGLFTGCTGAALDGETLAATVKLLTRLGYGVTIPREQGCCGAPQRHGGAPELARGKALDNLDAFPLEQLDAIIYVASGCGSELVEYARLTGLDSTQRRLAALLSDKSLEINQFLADITWPTDLKLEPLECTVALHTPCSQKRITPGRDPARELLERIPQLTVTPLPASRHCCGAAGEYMLRHPEIAAELLKPYLVDLEKIQPQFVASSNIGCTLHLGATLREWGRTVELLHPVTLLARQVAAAS